MSLDRYPVEADDFDGPVLVTGAGGCIGAWVLALLERAGVPVVAFDLADDKRPPEAAHGRCQGRCAPLGGRGHRRQRSGDGAVVRDHDIRAIIHLAALQVPFCKADPINGAKVNVVGTVNVFEAARARILRSGWRLRARSRRTASFPIKAWLPTLYGAYKYCDEMIAKVYAQDWDVPSVGIRPGVVYGIGRDQGMTSKTTTAILAAAADKPYTIPFSGAVSGLHAGEVASAFIKAVSIEPGRGR